MIKYSQETIDIIDVLTEKEYGITVPAVQQKLTNMIIRCYKKGMSIDEIAELSSEESKKIYDILVVEKLILT